MEKLYYVCNVGCDDETCGLVRITDEEFPRFKKFIENLNKNSTYGCMPEIFLYEISESDIRPANDNTPDYARLYLDDSVYELSDSFSRFGQEAVIR